MGDAGRSRSLAELHEEGQPHWVAWGRSGAHRRAATGQAGIAPACEEEQPCWPNRGRSCVRGRADWSCLGMRGKAAALVACTRKGSHWADRGCLHKEEQPLGRQRVAPACEEEQPC